MHSEYSILGKRLPRPDGPGKAVYADDMALPGMLHGALLRTLWTREATPWLAEADKHVLKNIKEVESVVLLEELEKRLGDPYAKVEVPLETDQVLRKLEEMSP